MGINYNNEKYSVDNLIINSPSNHMIMGKSFDLELQIYATEQKSSEKIALVALFQAYDNKRSDFLDKLGFSKVNQNIDQTSKDKNNEFFLKQNQPILLSSVFPK